MALVFKTPKTAINTTTRDIQNIKDGECPPCPECPEVELTTAEVEYTENGSFTVTPESGFDGLSQVDITVNIDTQAIEDAAYAEGEAAGIVTGKAQGVAEQKAKLTSTTLTTNGTVTREDGWNEVTVNVDTTTPYNEGVAAGIAEQKAKLTSLNVTSNGTYNKEDGYNAVTVDVQPELEAKTVSYASNGEYTITPTTGKDGISEATITVDVPSDVNNQNKTVSPTTSSQSVTADSGYSGLGTVTVEAVTSSIDANIQPENILEGITILGVGGTDRGYETGYEEGLQAGQEQCGGAVESGKIYNADTVGTYTVSPSSGYDAMDSVVVEVNSAPIGSMGSPWSKNMYFDHNFDNTNFIDAYFAGTVSNGSINSTTGKYDARIGSTITLHIDPFYDTGEIDPDTADQIIAFPPNFDLVGKEIIVSFEKQNVTKTGNNYDFANCYLVSIDGNTNQNTWLQEGSCPDWSSIGWDCNDVENSRLADEIAYTAQKKAQFEAGTINNFRSDGNLKWLPKVTLPSNCNSLFYGCNAIGYVPQSFDGQPVNISNMFTNVKLAKQPEFDWSEVTTADSVFYHTSYGEGVDFNPIVNAPKCTSMNNCFAGYTGGANSTMTTATINAPLVTNAANLFGGNKKLATVNLTLGKLKKCDYMFAKTAISTAPQLDLSECESIKQMFQDCSNITQFPNYDYSSITGNYGWSGGTTDSPFMGTSITTIPDFTVGDSTKGSSINLCFTDMSALTTIGNVTVTANCSNVGFHNSPNVTTIGGFTNLGASFANVYSACNIYLNSLSQLTKQSILNVFNTIADRTGFSSTNGIIHLSANQYATLTTEEIAIATAKNWSVTSA